MRLPVLEIEVRPNCWLWFYKAFPQFNRQLGIGGQQRFSVRFLAVYREYRPFATSFDLLLSP
jgi:hypothetical protein